MWAQNEAVDRLSDLVSFMVSRSFFQQTSGMFRSLELPFYAIVAIKRPLPASTPVYKEPGNNRQCKLQHCAEYNG